MRWILLCLALAIIACAVFATAWGHHPREAAIAWLVGWSWCFTISTGALGLDMLLEACGATWQVVLRRPLEAVAAPLAPLCALFLPIALSTQALYPWAQVEPPSDLRGLFAHRAALGGVTGWEWRSGAYLATLLVIALCLRRASPDQRRWVACAALPPYAIALTGASWDWFMSLDARFASTDYGAWVWGGGALAACGAWAALAIVRRRDVHPHFMSDHLVALGRLMLAFTLLAAYLDFSQLVVSWMADLPPEAGWYVPRLAGPWGAIGIAVGIGGYALPFLALLSLRLKRHGIALALVGAWIACWHHADMAWWLVPSCLPGRISWGWACLDLASGIAVGSATVSCALASLRWAKDPPPSRRLVASLAYSAEIG